jgi:hypothetical protein
MRMRMSKWFSMRMRMSMVSGCVWVQVSGYVLEILSV